MVARNDITGDSIQSKITNDNYRNNYDKIFRKTDNSLTDKNEYYDILSTEDCFTDFLDEDKK